MNLIKRPVVVRGGGDLATGTIHMLSSCGYSIIILETEEPSAIRRAAAFSEAVRLGEAEVDGMVCLRAETPQEAMSLVCPGHPVILVDPQGESIEEIGPEVVIDAIIAKKNLGTTIGMAPLTIALGPGFEAGTDVRFVVETMRGHDLGRVITNGSALPDTGVPGLIKGCGKERVMHSPAEGIFKGNAEIGDIVDEGQLIFEIVSDNGSACSYASIGGVLRGILPDGFKAYKGLKCADIDPRLDEEKNCRTISDKSRCIAGSVLSLVTAYDKGII